jgi:uroporphyrinogen-III synthase
MLRQSRMTARHNTAKKTKRSHVEVQTLFSGPSKTKTKTCPVPSTSRHTATAPLCPLSPYSVLSITLSHIISRIMPPTPLMCGRYLCAAFLLLGVNPFSVSCGGRYSKAGPLHATSPLVVAMTREEGKNDKLRKELKTILGENVIVYDLPCIAHADGEDFDRLGPTLRREEGWDYVTVTSPEAARVLVEAWGEGDFSLPVAAVGKATQATLEKFGIAVEFCPTKATAETLVEELPAKGDRTTVLYPASAKAASVLQDGLNARGFNVSRLNTYDTVTASWDSGEQEIAQTVHVACFGSPSSVNGWLENTENNKEVLAACIGETSAEACRTHEWPESKIFFPRKPGISGWAASVLQALKTIQVAHT